ncbi:MAG: hypothetical protein EOP07_09810 [Proteobacteria bacterium]|nr:MAG: hypothetical protein EOP07_09810 [Pseudomonadota bacterium]
MKIIFSFLLTASVLLTSKAQSEPKILYVGDSIAVETSDTVAWWSHNYIGATTTRAMFGGLTSCMQNLGSEKDAYYKKYYADAVKATQQITTAANEAGIPRPKIMWVLRGPTIGSDQAKRINSQYLEIAAANGDLTSDAGAEVSAAAYPDADYEKTRYEFTNFVPCSAFETSVGYCTDIDKGLTRIHRDGDGTHYCLGKMSGFSCSIPSPGILRYGMRIAQDIQAALKP